MKNILYLAFCIIIVLSLFSCKKKDKDFPVITLHGDASVTTVLNTVFTDPGADAYDETDGALEVDISDTVNTNLAGTYYLSYRATDGSGNSSTVTRVVLVSNQANLYNGGYVTETRYADDTIYYNSNILTSTILNNRVWITGFSTDSQTSVFMDISADSIITIPKQLVYVSLQGNYHGIYGTGVIKINENPMRAEIHFSDSVSGTVKQGIAIYTKN